MLLVIWSIVFWLCTFETWTLLEHVQQACLRCFWSVVNKWKVDLLIDNALYSVYMFIINISDFDFFVFLTWDFI